MPEPRRPFRSLAELDAQRLRYFEKMLEAGAMVAVPAALHYCEENQVAVPPWLLKATTELLCDLLKREKSVRRGRSCGSVARYRQDMIDFTRWDCVLEVRRYQVELKDCMAMLHDRPDIPANIRVDREKMHAWVGSTFDRAYECASMMLRGSQAFGSPEAMKRSYHQVKRNNSDPAQTMRYHLFDYSFSQRIGVTQPVGMLPAGKIVPLYELTL